MEIRKATEQDVQEITTIYNEGIEDRIATLETEIRTDKYVMEWLFQREKKIFSNCHGRKFSYRWSGFH